MRTIVLVAGMVGLFTWFCVELIAIPGSALATERSTKAVADFKRTHVCPSTGVAKNAPCPGQVVDHIMPLCFGGADSPDNMMFMPIAEAKKKDEFEREACALKRKCTAATPAPGAAAK